MSSGTVSKAAKGPSGCQAQGSRKRSPKCDLSQALEQVSPPLQASLPSQGDCEDGVRLPVLCSAGARPSVVDTGLQYTTEAQYSVVCVMLGDGHLPVWEWRAESRKAS